MERRTSLGRRLAATMSGTKTSGAALGLLTLLTLPANAQERPTVRTAAGAVAGRTEGAVTVFRGIPYARPPIGALRWRAPQKAVPWQGVRDAGAFGSICMQQSTPLLATQPAMSEDCLTANVWRPAGRIARPLPVLVWIHGGGWVSGSSAEPEYDGAALARRGILVVSFNYRLGRFGFFAHPELSRADPDRGWLGNYGYMDQLAALQWVKANVRAFGGDPARVTIFGSSAGAASVQALMIAPDARGLFSAAISSSAPDGDLPGIRTPSKGGLPSGEAAGAAFAKTVGVDDLAGLRALPAARILEGAAFPNTRPDIFTGPIVDGRLLTEDPGIAFANGRIARVPTITGAQSGEISGALLAPNADALAELLASRLPKGSVDALWPLYDPARQQRRAVVLLAMAGDRLFVANARRTATDLARLGVAAWEYRFDYVAEAQRGKVPGAGHGSNGAYAFDRLDALPANLGPFSSADRRTAADYAAYIVNFVKRHDPNGPTLAAWPRRQPGDQVLWLSNDGIASRVDPWAKRLDAVIALPAAK